MRLVKRHVLYYYKGAKMISNLKLPKTIFKDKGKNKDISINGFKLKNFIFGKNGTGKSTITNKIKEQYENTYDVRIFQGYRQIIKEDEGFSAIALGEKNAKLQPEIDKKESEISKLIKEEKNVNDEFEKAEEDYRKKNNEIENIYTKAASDIKKQYSSWISLNYDKRDFKKDRKSLDQSIKNKKVKNYFSMILKDGEAEELENILNQKTMKKHESEPINVFEMDKFLREVNDLITKNITQSIVLKFKSIDEENWVKQGLSIQTKGDRCAFCDSEISSSRWETLNSYFNDEVKSFENKLEKIKFNILKEIERIEQIQDVKKDWFYPKFRSEIDGINRKINERKKECIDFLRKLLKNVKKREENIFTSLDFIELEIPKGIDELNELCSKIFLDNNAFGNNLKNEQDEAKSKLIMSKVAQALCDPSYIEAQEELKELKQRKQITSELNDKYKKDIITAKAELKKLLENTIDESVAVEKINKKINSLGNQSFTLERVKNGDHKGQYRVKGRNISTLSTGEKNIVAFLWFIYDLENSNKKSDKEMVVVFDDPMNSNDDGVQYLIIAELQKILREAEKKGLQIFILTHNTHFYINLRYKWWDGAKKTSYDKTTFYLEKCGAKTEVIQIKAPDDDIKSNYDELWKEVKWLYNEDKPDFMLNPLRRIFETYEIFNGIDNMFNDDPEAQKLFNVNSHSIDDINADLNGKSRDAIMTKVQKIFEDWNAAEHFNYYWKNDE